MGGGGVCFLGEDEMLMYILEWAICVEQLSPNCGIKHTLRKMTSSALASCSSLLMHISQVCMDACRSIAHLSFLPHITIGANDAMWSGHWPRPCGNHCFAGHSMPTIFAKKELSLYFSPPVPAE